VFHHGGGLLLENVPDGGLDELRQLGALLLRSQAVTHAALHLIAPETHEGALVVCVLFQHLREWLVIGEKVIVLNNSNQMVTVREIFPVKMRV